MAITAFRGMKPGTQFIFALFIILVSFLTVFFLSFLVAIPVVGLSGLMNGFSGANSSDPNTIAVLKYFQVVQSIGLFVLSPFIIAYLYEGDAITYLNLNRKLSGGSILIGLLAVLMAGPLVGFLGELNEQLHLPGFLAGFETWMQTMEESAARLIDNFMHVETIWGLLFNIFMIAVIPALGEELLFRGVIQKIFTNMTRNYHWGIWISAFMFSALHMQFYGFLPRMLLGGIFGYLLVFSGSIWLPIIAHFINNLVGVLALYAENGGNETMDSITHFADSYNNSAVMAVISLVLTTLLLYFLKKRGRV